jgi:hypothetical protein
MNSPLRILHKIHAIKTFALLKLDHLLLNADVRLDDLMTLDQNITALTDQVLAVHSLPVKCHHWASLASSYHRADVLAIRSLVHMLMSPDAAIKEIYQRRTQIHANGPRPSSTIPRLGTRSATLPDPPVPIAGGPKSFDFYTGYEVVPGKNRRHREGLLRIKPDLCRRWRGIRRVS